MDLECQPMRVLGQGFCIEGLKLINRQVFGSIRPNRMKVAQLFLTPPHKITLFINAHRVCLGMAHPAATSTVTANKILTSIEE